MRRLRLDGSGLTLVDLAEVADRRVRVELAPAARRAMTAARRVVDRAVRRGARVYGVTTGFGNFADMTIPRDQIGALQQNLVRSHAAGVGRPLPDRVVRAMMVLRANALAKGHSGIRVETVEMLLAMLARDLLPVIPEQGSVGASGDLAPLAHLALTMTGEGQVRRGGRTLSARQALRTARIRPVVLGAKEGLALVNGVQMSVAVGGLALQRALRLAHVADICGAASLDAARGSDAPFDPRIVEARPHPGALASAANLRRLLAGSAIRESHRGCGKVQDNYALRCMPQVHGAARDALAHAAEALEREMNSATDNPLVFAPSGEILSGGNFHGAPVGLVLDYAAIAAADLASISERRIEKLVNPLLKLLCIPLKDHKTVVDRHDFPFADFLTGMVAFLLSAGFVGEHDSRRHAAPQHYAARDRKGRCRPLGRRDYGIEDHIGIAVFREQVLGSDVGVRGRGKRLNLR